MAGIKGGKKAEVDANTKNIILESACFDSASVRRTSKNQSADGRVSAF